MTELMIFLSRVLECKAGFPRYLDVEYLRSGTIPRSGLRTFLFYSGTCPSPRFIEIGLGDDVWNPYLNFSPYFNQFSRVNDSTFGAESLYAFIGKQQVGTEAFSRHILQIKEFFFIISLSVADQCHYGKVRS